MLKGGRSRGSTPDAALSCTKALGSAQPLTEMSTRKLAGVSNAAGAYG
jgi:hypothetical protein